MALTKKQLEEIIAGLNSKLEVMEKKIDALEGLPNTVRKLEELLESSMAENSMLKQDLAYKEKQLEFLQLKVNSLEQYNRSWSIRVNGIALTSEEEKSMSVVKKKVYDNLLLPIFRGAYDSGDLEEIPTAEQVLENAHVLRPRMGLSPSSHDSLCVRSEGWSLGTRRISRRGLRLHQPIAPGDTCFHSSRI